VCVCVCVCVVCVCVWGGYLSPEGIDVGLARVRQQVLFNQTAEHGLIHIWEG